MTTTWMRFGAGKRFAMAMLVSLLVAQHDARGDVETAASANAEKPLKTRIAGDAEPEESIARGAVVLLGSSSINDTFGHLAASDLRRQGYEVVRKGYAAAGLSRPDFIDFSAKATDLRIPDVTEAVLLYLGGNDAQAIWLRPDERRDPRDAFLKWDDEAWSEIYERRARDLVERLCRRGVRRVILLPPADVVSARMQRRLERIRNLQERAASGSTCGRFVSTSGDVPRFSTEAGALRAPDGVHMTRAGAVRVWRRVATTILDLLRA